MVGGANAQILGEDLTLPVCLESHVERERKMKHEAGK